MVELDPECWCLCTRVSKFISAFYLLLRKRRRRRNCLRLFREALTAWAKQVRYISTSIIFAICLLFFTISSVSGSYATMAGKSKMALNLFLSRTMRRFVVIKKQNCRRWVFSILYHQICLVLCHFSEEKWFG